MPLLEDLYELQRQKEIELVPFSYSAQWNGTITASVNAVPQTVTVQSDAHFVVRYINCMTYISGPSTPVIPNTGLAGLTIAIQDGGSSRNMQDNPQSIQNLCGGVAAGAGNGSLPMIMPEPWLIKAGSNVLITLGNRSVITFPFVEVSLVGFKVYPFQGKVLANVKV